MNHKDAWVRLKSYVGTRETQAALQADGGGPIAVDLFEGRTEAYADVLIYMEQVEKDYGLVSETPVNRNG